MTDIVERLRIFARDYTTTTFHDDLVNEAADRIEELENEIVRRKNEREEQTRRANLKLAALAKLSKEEREVLGF